MILKKITDRKINVALIGCGRISYKHLEAIHQLKDDLNLVAVCDIVESRAHEKADRYQVDYYTNYEKMLNRDDIDLVSICTPSGLHPEHGILAAKAGCHVLTEKPMGISLDAIDEMIEVTAKNQLHLFVVKQNRLNPTMQLLKKAIDKGRFGKIYLVQSNVFWQRPQEYYDQASWRGTWALDGGAFMNQASHYVDALLWLMGPVERVSAETATMARNIEAEDTGAILLKFKNGAIGTMAVTMLTYPKNFEGSITILGEKGSVKLGGVALNKIEKWEFDSYDDDDEALEKSNYDPPNIYGNGHYPYYQNVVKALKGEEAPNTNGESGKKSVELILSFYNKRISI